MGKYIVLAFGISLTMSLIYSGTVHQTWTKGAVSFTITPANLQGVNSIFTLSDSSATNPQFYSGLLPANQDDLIILQTHIYDCTNYDDVILRFSHIYLKNINLSINKKTTNTYLWTEHLLWNYKSIAFGKFKITMI
jgi:hypothetical protein